jgi:polyisoprenoid-binding protein YceI
MTTATEIFSRGYRADEDHSWFEARIEHMGVGSFKARFADVEATLSVGLDGLGLEGRAAVESISIRNPPEFREHVLNGGDFFDASRYPVIRFTSTAIELLEGDQLSVQGELTIRDTTKPITARGTYRNPVVDPFGRTRSSIDLSTTIDRREFGLDWQMPRPDGGDALGWDVTIEVHLELVMV